MLLILLQALKLIEAKRAHMVRLRWPTCKHSSYFKLIEALQAKPTLPIQCRNIICIAPVDSSDIVIGNDSR